MVERRCQRPNRSDALSKTASFSRLVGRHPRHPDAQTNTTRQTVYPLNPTVVHKSPSKRQVATKARTTEYTCSMTFLTDPSRLWPCAFLPSCIGKIRQIRNIRQYATNVTYLYGGRVTEHHGRVHHQEAQDAQGKRQVKDCEQGFGRGLTPPSTG